MKNPNYPKPLKRGKPEFSEAIKKGTFEIALTSQHGAANHSAQNWAE